MIVPVHGNLSEITTICYNFAEEELKLLGTELSSKVEVAKWIVEYFDAANCFLHLNCSDQLSQETDTGNTFSIDFNQMFDITFLYCKSRFNEYFNYSILC